MLPPEIRQALLEFVQNRNRRNLRELQGKILFDDGYDFKAFSLLRQDRDFDAMACSRENAIGKWVKDFP